MATRRTQHPPSLLAETGLGREFWSEAVTMAYIRDRCLTIALDNKTPYEARFGVEPNISHMKPFGCAVYVLIHDEQNGKGSNFDSKTHHCIITFIKPQKSG